MSGERRTHIQYSGSLRPEDAEPIIVALMSAIERRPKNCGAYMRVEPLGGDDHDITSPSVQCVNVGGNVVVMTAEQRRAMAPPPAPSAEKVFIIHVGKETRQQVTQGRLRELQELVFGDEPLALYDKLLLDAILSAVICGRTDISQTQATQ